MRSLEAKRKSARESARRFRATHPSYHREFVQKYRKRQKALGFCTSCLCRKPARGFKGCTKCRRIQSTWRKANRDTDYKRRLQRKYGLSWSMFLEILARQSNNCAVCLLPLGDDRSVDHDHTTNRVRGVLHHLCNLIVGQVEGNVSRVQRAVEYLHGS